MEPENGRLLQATSKHPEGREVNVPEPPPHLANSAAHFLWGIENDEAYQAMCRPGINVDAQEILEAGREAVAQGAAVELLHPTEMD